MAYVVVCLFILYGLFYYLSLHNANVAIRLVCYLFLSDANVAIRLVCFLFVLPDASAAIWQLLFILA